jgi:hypothetical protein
VIATNEDVLAYVARMMGISRAKTSELTGLANDAIAEVLDPEHINDQSLDRETVLEKEEEQVDLDGIAATFRCPRASFALGSRMK